MEVVRTREALKRALEKHKTINSKIAFVPTMGNLHQGHLKLVETAKMLADVTVVSIFVNKKQFGANEDFEKYPRTEEEDLEKLKSVNTTIVFIPKNEVEVYGSKFNLNLNIESLSNCLCGLSRPNFFGGVLAVILKLFLEIKPEFAIFGKKDYQQYLIVSALAESLDVGTEVIGVETIREESGLAFSSRNNYFKEEERKNLGFIYNALKLVEEKGISAIEEAKNQLLQNKVELEYLEVRSAKNLTLLKEIKKEEKPVLFFAGKLNGVRLIDNLELF